MPNRPRGGGPVDFVRSIVVKDGNGDDVMLHEYLHRRFVIRRVRRLKLDTGELVDHLGRDTFVVIKTGERLTRIR